MGLGACISLGLTSCSDFDEVNTSPITATIEYVKPQFALNNSVAASLKWILEGFLNVLYVYNWGSGARFIGENKFLEYR